VNRLLIVPAAAIVVGGVAIVAVVLMRGGGSSGDVAAGGAGARAWIDHPLAGAEIRLGETVAIRWHASAASGVERVDVSANGERLVADDAFDHEAAIANGRYEWTPGAAGEYVIEVTGHAIGGDAGASARKRVRVIGATPAGPAPTQTGGSSPSPITATSTARPGATVAPPTSVPVVTPSPALPTPSRTASPPSATPKPPTATPVPPTSTATPVPDTTPPPAPYTIYPKDDIVISPCPGASVILRWSLPSDPSGIAGFDVMLQKLNGPTWLTELSTDVAGLSKDVTAIVHCGDAYRWRVRATDNAGNVGPYSAWATFGMTLP
jgi:hypothetical protein